MLVREKGKQKEIISMIRATFCLFKPVLLTSGVCSWTSSLLHWSLGMETLLSQFNCSFLRICRDKQNQSCYFCPVNILGRELLASCPCMEPGGDPAGEEGDCLPRWTSLAQRFSRLDAILSQLVFGLHVQHRAAKRHRLQDLESTTQPHSRQMVFLLRLCAGGGGVVVTISSSSHLTGSLLPRICMTSKRLLPSGELELIKEESASQLHSPGPSQCWGSPFPGDEESKRQIDQMDLAWGRQSVPSLRGRQGELDLPVYARGCVDGSGTSEQIRSGGSVTFGTGVCLYASSWWRKCGTRKEKTQTSTPFPMTSREEFNEAKVWPNTPGIRSQAPVLCIINTCVGLLIKHTTGFQLLRCCMFKAKCIYKVWQKSTKDAFCI